MMFYLVFFCIIVCVTKAWLPRALILWSLAVIAGSAAIALDSLGNLVSAFPRAIFLFSPYILEFVAGCFIGLAFLKLKFVAGRISAVVAAVLFALEAIIFQAIHYTGAERVTFRVLLFGPPAALLVYGLLAWEGEMKTLQAPRWVIRCGDMSYSIYLVHLLVVHFAYRYAWRLFDRPGVRPLFMIAAAALALAASVIFYKLVEMPFSRWTRLRLEEIFRVPAKIAIAQPLGASERPA
jgi:exopolysaccharide production protein ExoZ